MGRSKFVFVFCMFILLSSFVQACVSYPLVETKNGCSIQFDKDEYRNSTSVMKKLNEMKSDCGLTDTDIFTLNFFVINGYSVKQQNKNEYKTFLGNAEKANTDRPSDCLEYEAVFNKNGWTGHIQGDKEYENEECVEDDCTGAVINLLWNDLSVKDKTPDVNVSDDVDTIEENRSSGFNYLYVVIPVFVIIALFVIFKLMVSGDKEEESKTEISKPIEENKQENVDLGSEEEKIDEEKSGEEEIEEEREDDDIEETREIKPVEKRRVEQRREEKRETRTVGKREEKPEKKKEEKADTDVEREEETEKREDKEEYGLV